jgi:hypothetical protein
MSRYGFRSAALILAAFAVTAGGCEKKFTFSPVEGTVTKNGRPLRDIEVVFPADPDSGTVGPRATGTTDEAGQYRLRGDVIRGESPPANGAVLSTHRVLLLDLEYAKKQLARSKAGEDAPRVPPRYESIAETPLRAKVGPELLVFNIEIP